MNNLRSVVLGVLRKAFWLYRPVGAALFGSACRHHPSCSAYMEEALVVHGPVQGLWLGLKRLGRCHPWHAGGLDLVPRRVGDAHEAKDATDAWASPRSSTSLTSMTELN